MLNYFTAICFDTNGKAYKYRNISKSKIINFEKFAKSKNIIYINYYFKQSRLFSHQEKI